MPAIRWSTSQVGQRTSKIRIHEQTKLTILCHDSMPIAHPIPVISTQGISSTSSDTSSVNSSKWDGEIGSVGAIQLALALKLRHSLQLLLELTKLDKLQNIVKDKRRKAYDHSHH
jgi:hypothetical protein